MNYPRLQLVDTRNRASRREIQLAQIGARVGLAGLRGWDSEGNYDPTLPDWTPQDIALSELGIPVPQLDAYGYPVTGDPRDPLSFLSSAFRDVFSSQGNLEATATSPAGYGGSDWLYENRQWLYIGAAAFAGLALIDALS